MAEEKDALKVVLGHIACWNKRDLEGFVSYVAEDVVNEFKGPKGFSIEGKAKLKEVVTPLFDDPKSCITFKRVVMDGNEVAMALVREQTDPKTKEIKIVEEADIFEVRDGKIQRVTVYAFDEMFFF